MAKPASKPDWTVGNPDLGTVTVEPTVQKKQAGWLADERPAREFMNWLFYNITEWISYFETVTDAIGTQLGLYDAVVGTGGTHADINALMADANIANLKNVFVTSSLAVNVAQTINQSGMTFTFHPKCTILKDGAATGLIIDAQKVRILNARFLSFNGGGDKAISLTANAKNCFITGCLFKDCTTMIDDALGTNNVIANNIEEV